METVLVETSEMEQIYPSSPRAGQNKVEWTVAHPLSTAVNSTAFYTKQRIACR